MNQITKLSLVLALFISLASCQSSQVGCYDFGEAQPVIPKDRLHKQNSKVEIKNVVCKP